MTTLDRYIIRNFLYSYLLCLLVMMGLRIVADLFVNMDEFAELDLEGLQLIVYVGKYYMFNALVYYQEIGGVVLVAAAAFSLARMNHTNELVAVLASGQSLHRVILPVVLVAIGLAMLGTVNQEVLIPSVKDELVRDRDDAPGEGICRVELIVDDQRNAWYSRAYRQSEKMMVTPLVLCRNQNLKQVAKISGHRGWPHDKVGWRLSDATVAVLDRKALRAGHSSEFVGTPRTPAVLAAEARPTVGDIDGLRITFDRVDRETQWLIQPRFEVLTPEPVATRSGERRVLAVLTAQRAWYDPNQKGYFLVGRSELTRDDVRHWRRLCRRMIARSDESPEGDVSRGLWSALGEPVREDVRMLEATTSGGIYREATGRIIAGLNVVIAGELIATGEQLDALNVKMPPAYMDAVARGDLTDAQRQWVNRLALDRIFDDALVACQGMALVPSSLTNNDIVLRRTTKWLDYMSSGEIGELLRSGRITDAQSARLTQHVRFAAPVINVIMLLLSLPFIVSRERHIKASALLCLTVVGGFHVFVFISRYLGQEVFEFITAGLVAYGFTAASPVWGPILAASMPILIFGPVAMVMLASMESMERPGENRTLGQILGTLDGRLNRATFWFRGMLPVLGFVAAALIVDAMLIRTPGLLTWAAVISAVWPLIALTVKRCHDRGRSGVVLMVLLIPILGWIWLAADVAAMPGDHDLNTFGPAT